MLGVIERAAMEAGIELQRDVPPPKNRRVRDWAKIIGLCRKLEAEDFQVLERVRQDRDSLTAKNAQLLEMVHRLERENEQLKLRERMRQLDLTRKDQQLLLGVEEDAA